MMEDNTQDTPKRDGENAPEENLNPKPKRRYTSKEEICRLAEDAYKTFQRGVVYSDLLAKGIASSKREAQATLKYHSLKGILFTIKNTRPQQYFCASMQDKVIQDTKILPIDPTGGGGKLKGDALETALQYNAANAFLQAIVQAKVAPL